ncbi:diguanylate cyclase [Limnospira fusiformis KN01]|uniref:Diguanylate cyclase n=1 Tax=Limnospira fusiformis PMC 851.14 TaxID=2219512 RepID=A0ABU9EKH8_LIMFS|nr:MULTISPECIES: diguanylate cyclase [Limnospira]MDC0839949.1 diguanylate cyclase [Limnoraphis robusta]MDY7055431.1 diguanylate cyclase [Limnospira fusiformis LS22]MDT9189877.1 diguanylate cyclase [Limnospira sp. PMC 894.15]MDT9194857.1 diguanylate cyclase [Limnospira sp. PMC 1245.20]MDT9196985.1 diguanylate cyclase [Limnospira sp. PMC 1042.18]
MPLDEINSYSQIPTQPELQDSEYLNSKDCFCCVSEPRAVKNRINQCLGIAKRHSLPVSLALMGMEGLDLCLQQQGYQKTDQVLMELIQEIQDHLRECDWVAYWGNNQFVMVIFSDPPGAKIALKRIWQAFKSREIHLDDAVITCSARIGFTQVHHNEHMNACLERMESALHKAKTTNKALAFLA